MNILFLSLANINSVIPKGIYTDLLRVFLEKGHSLYIVSPAERRTGLNTGLISDEFAENEKWFNRVSIR